MELNTKLEGNMGSIDVGDLESYPVLLNNMLSTLSGWTYTVGGKRLWVIKMVYSLASKHKWPAWV